MSRGSGRRSLISSLQLMYFNDPLIFDCCLTIVGSSRNSEPSGVVEECAEADCAKWTVVAPGIKPR